MSYEYKVVPAPLRGLKAKGVKTAEDRFANALETEMNALAADGWEYLRADTLPSEQREGLMSKKTVYQNMLVFRRAKEPAKTTLQPPQPPVLAAPPKSGEERLAERERLAKPEPAAEDAAEVEAEIEVKPLAGKKPSSDDVAAE